MQVIANDRMALRAALRMRLWRHLLDSVDATRTDALVLPSSQPESLIESVSSMLEEDLLHFAQVDPAAHGDPLLIFEAYSAFACVVHYRLAHAILGGADHLPLRRRTARWLADRGKVVSGVDIHPAAKIGRRFVLDHAMGTVVGETSEIGDNCYVLGGVVLGARGISQNPSGKRHPVIGNNVQIGSCARILGPVTVGDNAFIAAHCVVTSDVPANGRVSIVNQIQVHHENSIMSDDRQLHVFGAGVVGDELLVIGSGFRTPLAEVLDADFHECDSVATQTDKLDSRTLRISFHESAAVRQNRFARAHLRIRDGGNQVMIIEPSGLAQLISGPCKYASRYS